MKTVNRKIIPMLLLVCLATQVIPLAVFGAGNQESVTKDGAYYADVKPYDGNSSANLGDKVTANGEVYDITLNGKIMGGFVFNKNSPYIEITIASNVAVDILWNCGSKYADCTISVAGTYKIPQLVQDNGKTQNFNAIWVTNVREISIFEDTDGDGLPDMLEVKYGMNPNNPDTLGDGILDGDRIFTISETSEDWKVGDVVKPILNIQLQGKYIASLTMDKIPETDIFLCPLIPGYLGNAYDFNVDGSFTFATLTFEFDGNLWSKPDGFMPAIYYWNEEIQLLEELPDQTIIGNTVTASIEHFSRYILLNKVPFDKVWEAEIRPPNYGGIGAKPLDIVFSIDATGSMTTNDPRGIRKDAAKNFVDKLGENDLAAVVSFTTTGVLRAGFTSDKAVLYSAIDSIPSSGSTSNYRGLEKALEQFTVDSRNAYRYIIILSDGEDNSGPTNYTPLIEEAISKDVTIFSVGLGSSVNVNMLRNIAESTGGKYYHASTAGELIAIFDEIAEENVQTDTDNDGLPDYFEKLINDRILTAGNGVALRAYPNAVDLSVDNPNNKDSDDDDLMDGEEVIIRAELNADGITYKVWVYMFSNPCVKDTDGDGYDDGIDLAPLVPFKIPIILLHGRDDNSEKCFGITATIRQGQNSNYGSLRSKDGLDYTLVDSQRITSVNGGLGKELQKAGYEANYNMFVFNYPNQDMIYLNADKLDGYIDRLESAVYREIYGIEASGLYATKDDFANGRATFNLIGHSMGGLVSRYYIENMGNDVRIDKLITIDTPHTGCGLGNIGGKLDVPLAKLGIFFPCDIDLSIGSTVFGGKALDESSIISKFYSAEKKYAVAHQTDELEGTTSWGLSKNYHTTYYFMAGVDIDSVFTSAKLKNTVFGFDVDSNVYYSSNVAELRTYLEDSFIAKHGYDVGFALYSRAVPVDDWDDNVVSLPSQLGQRYETRGLTNIKTTQIGAQFYYVTVDTRVGHHPLNHYHGQNQWATPTIANVVEYLKS